MYAQIADYSPNPSRISVAFADIKKNLTLTPVMHAHHLHFRSAVATPSICSSPKIFLAHSNSSLKMSASQRLRYYCGLHGSYHDLLCWAFRCHLNAHTRHPPK